MLYLSKDEVKEKADSRYILVILVVKRARHLIEGQALTLRVIINAAEEPAHTCNLMTSVQKNVGPYP